MPALSGAERRWHERICGPFLVRVRGVAATGEIFDIVTVLDNFSAGGFYVRLKYRLAIGARLFAVVNFTTNAPCETPHLQIAVRSRIVRAELLANGRWGMGGHIIQYRFL
jgi:hypothetical protein